jgi:hypothetical protein
VRHVVASSFAGKRIVIFSGGEAKGSDEIRRGQASPKAAADPSGTQCLPASAPKRSVLHEVMDGYAKAKALT